MEDSDIFVSTRLPLLGFCVMESVHKMILLDDEDKWLLNKYNWHLSKSGGYPQTNLYENGKQKLKKLHCFFLPKKEGFEVDHINRNPLDNRRCNLRYVTPSQNQINKAVRSDNTSGYKGVTWHKHSKRWQARIDYNKVVHYIGIFKNKKDAARAYNKAAKELCGEFAYLNIIK